MRNYRCHSPRNRTTETFIITLIFFQCTLTCLSEQFLNQYWVMQCFTLREEIMTDRSFSYEVRLNENDGVVLRTHFVGTIPQICPFLKYLCWCYILKNQWGESSFTSG